jgi:hypothetical protein
VRTSGEKSSGLREKWFEDDQRTHNRSRQVSAKNRSEWQLGIASPVRVKFFAKSSVTRDFSGTDLVVNDLKRGMRRRCGASRIKLEGDPNRQRYCSRTLLHGG